MPNFTQCAAKYTSNPELIARYNYSGPTLLIPQNSTVQITYKGCLAVCGKGAELYPWSEAASTITTWILPVIGGVLLQAPWQSNEFVATMRYLFRLLGSPISSLSYNLWNIRVTGRCAMLVDMAVPYAQLSAHAEREFESIRDSFAILVNINMYKLKPIAASRKDCETVLRIMLFSTSLQLVRGDRTLDEIRHDIAHRLRVTRKRGVVPVFISVGWFLFAMVLSIQSAFGQLGANAVAHDLAIGLLLSWLPNIILTGLVDRNPAAPDDVREQLNELIDLVCDSLEDDAIRDGYISSLQNHREAKTLRRVVQNAALLVNEIRGDFLKGFAGQGRSRWHYGAAHPIICDIEEGYIADSGRGWLLRDEARLHLVLGNVEKGLLWFDYRGLWQFLAAVVYVNGSIAGAFILSYFTPTVGLGCRSGSYMVFAIISTSLFLAEMLVWFMTSPVSESIKNRSRQLSMAYGQALTRQLSRGSTVDGLSSASRKVWHVFTSFWKMCLIFLMTVAIFPFTLAERLSWTEARQSAETKFRELHHRLVLTKQHTWLDLLFTSCELANSVLLCRIIVAQVFGFFTTCACQCSLWSSVGGYMDLTQWNFSDNPKVTFYWTTGTVLTLTLMAILMIYVVVEWCLQSHLSTADYQSARNGLTMVRRYRKCYSFLRRPFYAFLDAANSLASRCFRHGNSTGPDGSQSRKRPKKTLIWTAKTRQPDSIPLQPVHRPESVTTTSPVSPMLTAPLLRLPSYTSTAGSTRSPRSVVSFSGVSHVSGLPPESPGGAGV